MMPLNIARRLLNVRFRMVTTFFIVDKLGAPFDKENEPMYFDMPQPDGSTKRLPVHFNPRIASAVLKFHTFEQARQHAKETGIELGKGKNKIWNAKLPALRPEPTVKPIHWEHFKSYRSTERMYEQRGMYVPTRAAICLGQRKSQHRDRMERQEHAAKLRRAGVFAVPQNLGY